MSVDLPDTRAGIVSLLQAIPELKTVLPYERADAGTNNLPCASIMLTHIGRPGYDQGETRLGAHDYACTWHINVRLAGAQPLVEVVSQQLFETLVMRVMGAALGDNPLIDANGPGVVDVSAVTAGDLLVPADSSQPFVAQFILETLVLA